ncbi:hypothetical protein PGS49_03345 [Yersinia intermedia]|uniref:hypothetical protein n=1 Tax=Yersinia intermedia TaxID=631 RepID=UPI0022FEA75C|nr:hypothetical protein [Yersinia intermedia]MDA5479696.1 hypothetical protein [Yersinia intermedia]
MTLFRLIAGCLFITSLAGCDSGTPKCNSDDAKALVVDIARKRTAELHAELAKTTITVENIRTIEHQSKVDIYQCAADLTFSNAGKTSSMPITYRIQKTDDNNGQFYINVFGLFTP